MIELHVEVLTSPEQWMAAFPVMRQLRDHLTEDEYLSRLREMAADGYRLVALYEGESIVALAGIGRGLNFYYGRYLWVYDLITAEESRSRGYGKALLEHVEGIARREGCDTVALSSALHRADAHRFYENRMSYERASYTFKKALT